MPFAPDPRAVESPRIAELAAYWERLRGERPVPLRSQLEPAEIKDLLPYVMLVELESDPFRVRYRLVGTEVVTWSKLDFTGLYLDQLDFSDIEEPDVFTRGYREMQRSGRPQFGRIRTFQVQERTLYYECGLLPLSSDGRDIDRAVAIEDYEKLSTEHLKAMRASYRK